MAHKRFITSGISTDERLAPVAAEDVQCALMWPWLLLEFDDWGRAEFSPVRTKLSRFPAFAALSPEDIERAINLFIKHGLMHKYEEDDKSYLAVRPRSWIKHQTYLVGTKRPGADSKFPAPENPPWSKEEEIELRITMTRTSDRSKIERQLTETSAANSECQLTTADVSRQSGMSVPSLSPSPSPSPTKTKNKKDMSGESAAGLSAEFDEWWEGYPRKDAKKEALAKYKATRRKGVAREDLFRARDVYARYVRSQATEKQFMLLAKTFLGPNERWRDWLKGPPVTGRSAEPASASDFADERREIDELFGGDQRAWWQWRKAGKPEIGEWHRGRGNGSAGNGAGDREKPG